MSWWTYREDGNQTGGGVLQIDGVMEVTPDWWGPDGQVIARDLRQAISTSGDVLVYINSPGGDVMAGAEVYSALREHSTQGRGKVTVKVTGIAASAASIVAMAGDEVYMSPVAYMMIHNPWTSVQGDASSLRKQAAVLDVITEGLINAYELRTGKNRTELQEMLDAETYMSAQTCVDEGFADGILYMDDAPAPAPSGRGTLAKLPLKNYGRERVLAMIGDDAADDPAPDGVDAPSGMTEQEAADRSAIARQAIATAAQAVVSFESYKSVSADAFGKVR